MSRLRIRVVVAFCVMEGVTAMSAALWHIYGPGRGAEVREFPSAFAYALFASVMAVPFHVGALLGVIVPVAVLLRRSFSLPTAIVVAVALSVPAFCVVVIGRWLIAGGSLADFVVNVLRFPRSNARLLAIFAVGGTIVLAGRRDSVPVELPEPAR
jgi:hypothetical protein